MPSPTRRKEKDVLPVFVLRTRVMLTALCLIPFLAACAAADSRPVAGVAARTASAPRLVKVVAEGRVGPARWRVNLMDDGGLLCTQAMVDGHLTGRGCDPPVSRTEPVNIALDGLDPRILLVYGAVDASVARLVARDAAGGAQEIGLVHGPRNTRFFAYAVRPHAAEDLVAFDASRDRLYSAGGKIHEFTSELTSSPRNERR